MSGFLRYYFHWYDGNVYGNLIASVLWSLPVAAIAVWRISRRLNRRLDERLAEHHRATHDIIRGLHGRLDELHKKIDDLQPDSDQGVDNDVNTGR